MRQTSTEWLYNKWMNEPLWDFEKIKSWFEQARELEKQQIMGAWVNGWESQPFKEDNSAEQYYNATYNHVDDYDFND